MRSVLLFCVPLPFNTSNKKMKIHTLKSETVCHDSERFLIMVGVGHYNLGFQFQNWGIRFMLIWWHICIHF